MSLRAVVRHRHRLAAAARTVRAGRPASRRSSTETAAKEAAAPPDRVPVAPVAGAAAAAILTVMATSVAAERLTASSAPPFDPRGDRFDQATFFGRFAKMLLACDPALLLNGREEVLRCQRVVEGHAKHLEERPDGVSATEASRQIWEAQVSGSRPASRRVLVAPWTEARLSPSLACATPANSEWRRRRW